MPQMSPIWWMTMMLMFNSLLLISMCSVYFNFMNNMKLKKKLYNSKFKWMW